MFFGYVPRSPITAIDIKILMGRTVNWLQSFWVSKFELRLWLLLISQNYLSTNTALSFANNEDPYCWRHSWQVASLRSYWTKLSISGCLAEFEVLLAALNYEHRQVNSCWWSCCQRPALCRGCPESHGHGDRVCHGKPWFLDRQDSQVAPKFFPSEAFVIWLPKRHFAGS